MPCWLLAGGSFLFGLLQKLTDNTATGSPQSKTEGVREPRREGERKEIQTETSINKGRNFKNKTNEKLETEIHKWIESEIQNLLT